MAGIGVHDDRNRCSPSVGIGVHLRPEWVFMMGRITQLERLNSEEDLHKVHEARRFLSRAK
jgi:hypothetical protein